MTLYVIHTGGYESSAWIVEADSEAEAVGKAQLSNGWVPDYADVDIVEELMEEGDVVKVAQPSITCFWASNDAQGMTMSKATEVESGIELVTDELSREPNINCDVVAYADDGEHKTLWHFTRMSAVKMRIETFRMIDGVAEFEKSRQISIPHDMDSVDFAENWADEYAEDAMEATEDFFR